MDADLAATALRETEEELGIPRTRLRLLGPLTPVPAATSRFTLNPFVAAVAPGSPPRPNPAEVAELITIRLEDFFAGSIPYSAVDLGSYLWPIFQFGPGHMYGATAHVLLELLDLVGEVTGRSAPTPERTQQQRQADALVELCSRGIGEGLPRLGGRRPQLTVIVRTELGSEVAAEVEGVGPIALGTLARLRGEDHVERRQTVDGRGVTLNFGRARRCHSEAQRLEISTRHPNCVVPGCSVPIRDCEIHHPQPWKLRGDTDTRGVPLCRRKHHRQVAQGMFELELSSEGRYELIRGPS